VGIADPARRHNATQAVLNAVRTYGAAHAHSYGDVRDNNGQVVASFTGDLDEHLAQLQLLVSNPASVAVEQAACSSAYLATITSAIRERFAGDPRRVLWRTANGSVGLRAPFEHLAAELHAEYGDVLKITVGSKPYPPTRISPADFVPLPSSTIDLPGLEVTFDPGSDTVAAGEDLHGSARLTNAGAHRIAFSTGGVLIAGVRRHGDDYLAGGFTGALAAGSIKVHLAPRESRDLHLIVGTTSCLPDSSYAVPPGSYEILARLSLHLPRPDGGPSGRRLLVRRGPSITVTS
jgi:hypothetical protein